MVADEDGDRVVLYKVSFVCCVCIDCVCLLARFVCFHYGFFSSQSKVVASQDGRFNFNDGTLWSPGSVAVVAAAV